MNKFKINSEFKPTGDQPEAIKTLSKSIEDGHTYQTLLGVTGSGKTFTMANVIEQVQKPTLIIAHNKTLAAQLYSEFKEFFPSNAVEYFVSYYDYYQPEAYVAHSDTFIEKDSSVNEEIDKLRHSATAALSERRDVIIVASVSCIYGLGDPIDYENQVLSIRIGMELDRDDVLRKLVQLQYDRNDHDFARGTFRVRGDVVEIIPAGMAEEALRVEFFGDEIERISEIDTLTGNVIGYREHASIFPASHYAVAPEKMMQAIRTIEAELEIVSAEFMKQDKILEMQRLTQRTNFDVEMLREMGYCSGVENYSRHLSGRAAGSTPFTLLDYFPDDFLIIVDESHMTLPQIRGMYNGDKARKTVLVEHGFRLPSALDNRPLIFDEFEEKMNQILYVSATPSQYEIEHSSVIAEQLIRPTGLLDPVIEVRPVASQIQDLLKEITVCEGKVLITTLTKRMSEDLTEYLREAGVKVKYLHSDIDTLERIEIVRDLRLGVFDVLVGINLLREGLDIPEVTLVAILDADKEGFLRSETSLIQTIGRAARNADSKVIMYADVITRSMDRAISETTRRREIQEQYNEAHGITPTTVKKAVRELIVATKSVDVTEEIFKEKDAESMTKEELESTIAKVQKEMKKAATQLNFEKAADYRDMLVELKSTLAQL